MEAPDSDGPDGYGDSEFRCAAVANVGLVASGPIYLSGAPDVSGPYGTVFSGTRIQSSGRPRITGNLLSAGPISYSPDQVPAVQGSILANETYTVTLPSAAPDVSARASNNDNDRLPAPHNNASVFRLNNGQSVTVPAGDYYFQSMAIENSASLRVSGGTATFYLTGGAVFNGATNAGRLRIISSGSQEFSFNGYSQINIDLLYAPNAVVRMTGDQTLTGSVAAREIHLSESGKLQTSADVLSAYIGCSTGGGDDGGSTTSGGSTTTTSGSSSSDSGGDTTGSMPDPMLPDLPELPS